MLLLQQHHQVVAVHQWSEVADRLRSMAIDAPPTSSGIRHDYQGVLDPSKRPPSTH
jgi:hypothetical protein